MEISSLPGDVLLDILMRLPVKPLIRFSLSSKQYLSLIHHPHFINRHLSLSKTNPSLDDTFLLLCYFVKDSNPKYFSLCSFTDGGKTLIEHKRFQPPIKFGNGNGNGWAKIVGSSNGLVCLSYTKPDPHPGFFDSHVNSIILWNVVIGKYKEFRHPYLSTFLHRGFSHASIAFGFVLETNDFKVVQIRCYGHGDIFGGEDSNRIADVWVYSVELNNWRKIEANIALSTHDRFRNSNVYVNGAVHWLVYSYKKLMDGGFPHSIISFDLKGEVFKEMALPNNRRNRHYHYHLEMSASACGETLTLFLKFDGSDLWEVWLMKEYGVVDSWTRQFCIAEGKISKPWKVMENGDVLLERRRRDTRNLVLCDAETQQMKDLVLCDANNQKMTNLGVGIDPPKDICIVTCSSSLSLLDGGEKVLG